MTKNRAPKAIGKASRKPSAKRGINLEELAKIQCVEGQEAHQNFVNLTRQLLAIPKSDIVEMERNRKKKP